MDEIGAHWNSRSLRLTAGCLLAILAVEVQSAPAVQAQSPQTRLSHSQAAQLYEEPGQATAPQASNSRRFPSVFGWGQDSDGAPRIGSPAHREAIIQALPLDRLTPDARVQILEIAENPTLFRQLPSQAVQCDQDMFLFLTRNPDVLVGLWDLMDITKVQCQRLGPYQIKASDQAGTVCKVDLVYGDSEQHIFVVEGMYDGKMVPTPIRGKGVFVLHSAYAQNADGNTTISGTLDCFVQLESLGLDLIARTFSPIIGRSADSNFVQTARFISQVSQASSQNPAAMLDVANRLPQVEPPVRKAFADTIVTVARRGREIVDTDDVAKTAERVRSAESSGVTR
tara:strand:- start:249 stop:1268 length:1020 start_codon:yes stop_codon:yes gene_type:complete